MERRCSFCSRAKGEGHSKQVLEALESGEYENIDPDSAREIAERLRSMPDRKARLILPGPGDLAICDLCIDLYRDAAERELGIPT